MKFETIFLSIIFTLTYLISVLFWFQGLNEVLTIIMMLPAFAAIISVLIEFKSFKELLKPFFKKISFKGLVFTIIFPLTAIFFCRLVAIFTSQGVLLTSWSNIFMTTGNLIVISIVFFILGLNLPLNCNQIIR